MCKKMWIQTKLLSKVILPSAFKNFINVVYQNENNNSMKTNPYQYKENKPKMEQHGNILGFNIVNIDIIKRGCICINAHRNPKIIFVLTDILTTAYCQNFSILDT